MNLHDIMQQSKKIAADNAPAILTAIGVTGTLTAAYLTGKASFKARDLIFEENVLRSERDGSGAVYLTTKEEVELVWKEYIPAAGTTALTIACIVFASRIGTRRTAAMAAAYTISERAYAEYKDKVVEQIGKNKEQKVRDEIAQDRVTQNPVSGQQVIITGGGDVLCMDKWSGRYFQSDMETMKKAQNDTNHQLLNHDYASLTDFYSRIGLAGTKESDDVGWCSGKQLLELTFSTAMSDDQRPCLVMDFGVDPIRNFFRTH